MRSIGFLVLLVLSAGLLGRAEAAGPSWWPWPCHGPHCPTCPDDYCPKRLPCVCPEKCHGANDYCPKPLPAVCPVKCFLKNDYCPKDSCIPIPCCWPAWYTCGGGCK